MELQLLNGTFNSNESIELVNKLFQVKIKFHEEKISKCNNEEDIKMRERKIKFLQNELAHIKEIINAKKEDIFLYSKIII